MNPTFQDLGDGTFTMTPPPAPAVPFDPVATQSLIDSLNAQMQAAVALATSNAQANFQPQIDALQSLLDAATTQVPAIADMLKPATPMTPADPEPAQT